MTNEAIKIGFDNLKDGKEYDNLYFSAKCRAEADWLVGINASRAFTLKFDTLLSIGRVQTPTLAIIVQRHKEIEKFDIKEYFEINATFQTENLQIYNGIWINKKSDSKIFDKLKAQKVLNEISKKDAIVSDIKNEEKRQLSPLLYDLTELQRDCNKKFSYSAQKTLSIAQNLYEKRKLITYPRTDSRYLSSDMKPKLKGLLQSLANIQEYNFFINEGLNLNKLKITKRIIDNSKITDHHAIIPNNTKINLNSLDRDDRNVYDLIVRRYISVFYGPYIYNITKITTNIEDNIFLTKGTTIIDKGYTLLNITNKKNNKEEILPNVIKSEKVSVKKVDIISKKTVPPSHYNEATLLSAMENAGRFIEDEKLKESLKESGLGTPATRASIIEKLIKIGYIIRNGKNLIPTKKGVQLIEVTPNELKSPETTGKWEKALSLIAKGDMQSDKFMKSIKNYVNFLVNYTQKCDLNINFDDAKSNSYQKYTNNNLGKCYKCDGVILENSKGFYCSNWKKKCSASFWKNSIENKGIILNANYIKTLLKGENIQNIPIIDSKNGTKKLGNISLNENGLSITITNSA